MALLLVLALLSPWAVLAFLLASRDAPTDEEVAPDGPARGEAGAGARPRWRLLAPWTPLPALLAALFLPEDLALELPWLFLGALLRLDRPARLFLGLTAAVWLAAGWYARGYLPTTGERPPGERRFWGWFLATMGGNLLLVPCQDMVSFTAFFTAMSLAAYGLVIHHPSARNLAAGRVYLALAILGEVLAFAGLVWACQVAQGEVSFAAAGAALAASPARDAVLWLLIAGFGIKLGLVPLHVWLPLAHPAAPTPASAVLSGVIIKTGLLLWWRVFPWGAGALLPGAFLVVAGLAGTFGAALVGLVQTDPKALLAYSSVSQMGLVALMAGLGLIADAHAGAEIAPLLTGLGLFAVHHGLTKGALFLGVGLAQTSLSTGGRRLVMAGLALLGASLAGFPLTSGQAAKAWLKALLPLAGPAWQPAFERLVPLSGVTTMLLLLRFLALLPRAGKPGAPAAPLAMLLPWAGLGLGTVLLPVILVGAGGFPPAALGLSGAGMAKAALPPLAAMAMAAFVWWKAPAAAERCRAGLAVPAGDLLHLTRFFSAAAAVQATAPTAPGATSPNAGGPPAFSLVGESPSGEARSPAGQEAARPPALAWCLSVLAGGEGFSTGLLLMVLLAAGLALLL
ncbi:MAG: monovalent cation/H+ antiporter subunit [Candidatus Ozemobacter sibiricus]|jgi:formate hydrogenlyase subunit 3/multisubunit Na+/H+ antiporter MnhD subunit|uniref:Monovalent cation/H+ antiporter subunit n=1 Tax=Candidatus Ozemobacter sibiricus TaxID=2268124 RepID=A0A367ZIU1_9BACT|nr:MAG: monovalent cation/H+ antiporter subunit [Candidatus Ozemobacter sibiricus]